MMTAYSIRCVPPWSDKEIEHKVDDALKAEHEKPHGYWLKESVEIVEDEFSLIDVGLAPKPTFPEAALYGLLGDITRFIAPQTEADPAAIYTQLLIAYGNNVGRKAFFQVERTRHYTNLFAVLVGRSSKGRKGTALDYVKALYAQADLLYLSQFAEGLSSGEGLIWAVRDPIVKTQYNKKEHTTENIQIDPGVIDKRLLVTETEFARPLKVMARPTNILSTILRKIWDDGDLRTLTKNEPARATNVHGSVIAHITEEELEKELTECDLFNGFANRFLWLVVERSQLLPEGGKVDQTVLDQLALRLKQPLFDATSSTIYEMRRDEEAREHWHSIYAELSAERPGMLGAVTNRAEAQVLRISMILALTDGSHVIRLPHQQAALTYWDYCFGSARHLFGHRLLDTKAQRILEELRRRPEGMTRWQISDQIFGRNEKAERIVIALRKLLELKLAYHKTEPTSRRNAERWFASIS